MSIEELELRVKDLEKSNLFLMNRLSYYEQDGVGKLYYSLQRKANEMADLLNKTKLTDVDIDDPKNKTFERLQKIWVDAGTISASIKSLETLAGIVSEEVKDSNKKDVIINKSFSPESVADAVGELAGKKN